MEHCIITLLTIDRYDEVYKLWETHEGVGLSGADSRDNIARFLERNEGLSFVALIDNKIIGTVLGGHDGRRGYIYHLIVDSSFRSNGIGSALAGKCIQRFKEIGIEKSHVFVFKKNKKGAGFWESTGYKKRNDLLLMSLTHFPSISS